MGRSTRVLTTLAATGALLLCGAGLASASESATAAPAAKPNCVATTVSGAVKDPAGTVKGTLAAPGKTVHSTVTCVASQL